MPLSIEKFMSKDLITHIRNLALVIAVASATFLLDIKLPLGVAGGVPYVILILTGMLFPWPRIFIFLGLCATFLTLIGFFLSPEYAALWIVITNRIYAIVAIWVTVFILSLKRKEKSLLEEITLRRELELKLYDAVKSTDKANKAKTAFFGSMSHDLRTPLNAIIGFSEAIDKKIFGTDKFDKYFEYASDIHKSSLYLLQLINDILDAAKLESGAHVLHLKNINVKEVVYSCHDLLNKIAKDKNIDLKISIADDILPLFADPLALQQIIVNLLSNSIKFTPNDGTIILSVKTAKNQHIIKIEDTGAGISEEALKTITKPFTREDNDHHKAQEGSGLGLSIVKSLVELHHGELEIQSVLDKGTTIIVTLPSKGF